MAYYIYQRAQELGYNAVSFHRFPATFAHGAEPPTYIAEAMQEHDMNILLTWDSISHTKARREASAAGARIMTSPELTAAMMENSGPLTKDYSHVNARSKEIAQRLDEAQWAQIWSSNGTKLIVYFEGEAHPDLADLSQPGTFANLPAGEGSIGLTYRGEGVLVGLYEGEQVKVQVVDGYATQVLTDTTMSQRLHEELFEDNTVTEETLHKRRQLAELGIGTNTALENNPEQWAQQTITAEKIPGAHIAFGNNESYGGDNDADYHQDLVVIGANVDLDRGPLLRNGVLTEPEET